MKRAWIVTGLAGAGLLFLAHFNGRLYVPQRAADTRTERAVPDAWLFSASGGRQASISMPILQRFHYPGDVAFCAKLTDMEAGAEGGADPTNDCDSLPKMPAAGRAEALTQMATQLPIALNVQSGSPDSRREEATVLALSVLREAMQTVPRDAPDAALAILDNYWIGELLKQPEPYYTPAFLFQDAFLTEVIQARLALCRLSDNPLCADKIPLNAPEAVESVGRWTADLSKLMLSIELTKSIYSRNTHGNPYVETSYAQDLAGTYGYAAEIVTGNEKLVYLRLGVTALEQAYDRYQMQVDADTRQSLIGSLGTIYGRIAFISRDRADTEKALRFDEDAARLQRETEGSTSWEKLSNLGDSKLLYGEIFKSEEDLRQGLSIQRQALDKATADSSVDGQSYVKMKIAQTLVRYVEADGTSLSGQDRIAMLEESRQLATAMIAVFEPIGTTTYVRQLTDVLRRGNLQMATMGGGATKDSAKGGAESDWKPAPPPQRP